MIRTRTRTDAQTRTHAGESGEASTVHHSDGSLAVAASLLCVDGDALGRALTSRTVSAGAASSTAEVLTIRLRPTQAADTRDALAKGLYSRMFVWLVGRINDLVSAPPAAVDLGIAALDIFGCGRARNPTRMPARDRAHRLEQFVMNSFEQLCINYANEKLQYHFNDGLTPHMFTSDQINVWK